MEPEFDITMLFNGGLIPGYMIVYWMGLIDNMAALLLPGALNVFNMLVVINYMRVTDHYPLQTYLQTVVINPEAFFRNATNISEQLGNYLKLVNARTTNAAQMFLAMLPVLAVYPFLQKYFTTGLVMGSVKG